MRRHGPLCLLLLSVPLAAQESGPTLDPLQPYRAELLNPVTYQFDFAAVVTPPEGCKVLKVWLPIPPTDKAQRIEDSRLETFPLAVAPVLGTETVHGNQFAYFEFKEPKGAQMVRHRFKATTHELRFRLEPAKVATVRRWPESFAPYLRGESQAVVVDEAVRKVALEIVPARSGGPRDAAGDVFRVIDWVSSQLAYDHSRASLQASSLWALENRAGHCSDYHGLCSALGRCLGHPTRVTYGWNTFPKNSLSHCKAEVFLPPYGWVSFDVSETQNLCKRVASEPDLDAARKTALIEFAKRRLFSGYRDNTWLLLTRGTDYELAPPARKRVAVVRTIYAEADGEALPEPDPGDKQRREFAWMTLQSIQADREVAYPFQDVKGLAQEMERSR